MDRNEKNEFLTSFKLAYQNMVATNDNSYNEGITSYRFFHRLHKKYTLKEIEEIIEHGSIEAKITLSRNFYNKGGIYQRLIIHYATLLKYTGLVIPNPVFGKSLSEPYIEKKYNNAVNFVDKAQLPDLFTNIAIKALRDGAYYGILLGVGANSISILDLPTMYCRSRFKDTDGNDLIEFNVMYFDTIVDEDNRKAALAAYPGEVARAYRKWKKSRKNKWVFLPAGTGMCIPFLDGAPAFLSVIPAAIEYDQARDINKERDLEEIRKIIVQKIPHLQGGELLFEPDEAEVMHKGAADMLKKNENVSVLTTYADVDAIVSKTSNDNSTTSIDKALYHIYSEAGASPQLFGTESNLSLETSINNDMAMMMMLARKLEKFVTFILNSKFGNSNISFKYSILPITYYNESKYIENALKLANSGYSFIIPALAMGLSQKELGNIKDLENDVLKLKEKLIPLSTSYTESGNVGRPELPAQEKSAKTIANEKSLDGGGSNANG